ncbi:MAG: hypothetical protein EBS00_02075, partial [Verrucomicrobia bacterium]|nr:hypothetical protein [Verrucomicrobiota bacterium]
DNYTIIAEQTTPRINDVLRAGHATVTYTIVRPGASPVKGFSTPEQAELAVARMRREFADMLAYMNRNSR